MEPAELTYQRLQEITDGFSEERKLGEGAYGKVYRGGDTNGEEIAVKMLHNVRLGLDDEQFKNEFDNLRKLNHRNIVKLIGYCYETQHKFMEYYGKTIFAEQTCRALCLEYLHNGSLQNHLSDGCDGLDWHTRYKIIKGTCEGLKYLHEGQIYHLDLKPNNILLDDNMVPKLADFGLSKVFGEEQTQITQSAIGTLGYMPPEYIESGEISKMFHIISLGVVMIKIILGPSGRSKSAELPTEEFIGLVIANWSDKLQAEWSGSLLEAYCQQVKRCTEIALKCMENNRHNRPNIADIIHELSETETEIETVTEEISRNPRTGSELLNMHPFQLRFHLTMSSLEPNKSTVVYCPLHLTNNTDHHVNFRLLITKRPKQYIKGPLFGCVCPRSRYACVLRLLQLEKPVANSYEFFTLKSCMAASGKVIHRCGELTFHNDPETSSRQTKCRSIFEKAKDEGGEVHRVKLMALYEPPGATANSEQPIKPGITILSYRQWVYSLDVHPTEPWIVVALSSGFCIWNYQMQQETEVVGLPVLGVTSAKFIARKKWFVAGDETGSIYVHSYDPVEKIRHLRGAHSKSVSSLAIHATEPYMLSASKDDYIKLWDYEKDWKIIKVFVSFVFPWQHTRVVLDVAFNPKDSDIFASAQIYTLKYVTHHTLKIWNLHCSQCTLTTSEQAGWVHCLEFFSRGNELYLIGGCDYGIAKIWDCQTGSLVQTLEGHMYCAPDIPILITGSIDGTVCLWNSITFK